MPLQNSVTLVVYVASALLVRNIEKYMFQKLQKLSLIGRSIFWISLPLLACLSGCRETVDSAGPCASLLDCCSTLAEDSSATCQDSYDRFHNQSGADRSCAEALTNIQKLGMCTPGGLDGGVSDGRGSENTEETCSDGLDNDGDGYTDCDDYDCSRNDNLTICNDNATTQDTEDTDQKCSDGLDNDGDGYTDCHDYDCSRNSAVSVCYGTSALEVIELPIANTPGPLSQGLSEVIVSGGARSTSGSYLLAGVMYQVSLGAGAPGRAFVAKVTNNGSLESSFGQGGVQLLNGKNCIGPPDGEIFTSSNYIFISYYCGLWSIEKSSGTVSMMDKEVFGRPVASDGSAVYFLRSVTSSPPAPLGVREPFVIERRISPTELDPQYGGEGVNTANQLNATLSPSAPIYVTHRPGGLVFAGSNFDSGSGRAVVAQLTSSGLLDTSFGNNGFAFDSQSFQYAYSVSGVTATATSVTVLVDDYDNVPIRLVTFPSSNLTNPVSSLGPESVTTAYTETTGNEATLGMRAFEDPDGYPAMLIARPLAGGTYSMTTISGVRVSGGFFANGSTFVTFGNRNFSTTPVATFVRGSLPN